MKLYDTNKNILFEAEVNSIKELVEAAIKANISLSNANLSNANLFNANLSNADLSNADLSNANLIYADLSYAYLSNADLSYTNLSNTNLSNSLGLKTPQEFLSLFQQTDEGIIVYKKIGDTDYPLNSKWVIEKGNYLEEVVNPNRTNLCGCGVNFGTKEWVRNYNGKDTWECLIEWIDLSGVVVPYNTDGKARCSRLKLVKILNNEEIN